jgi:hypothetical protein
MALLWGDKTLEHAVKLNVLMNAMFAGTLVSFFGANHSLLFLGAQAVCYHMLIKKVDLSDGNSC